MAVAGMLSGSALAEAGAPSPLLLLTAGSGSVLVTTDPFCSRITACSQPNAASRTSAATSACTAQLHRLQLYSERRAERHGMSSCHYKQCTHGYWVLICCRCGIAVPTLAARPNDRNLDAHPTSNCHPSSVTADSCSVFTSNIQLTSLAQVRSVTSEICYRLRRQDQLAWIAEEARAQHKHPVHAALTRKTQAQNPRDCSSAGRPECREFNHGA